MKKQVFIDVSSYLDNQYRGIGKYIINILKTISKFKLSFDLNLIGPDILDFSVFNGYENNFNIIKYKYFNLGKLSNLFNSQISMRKELSKHQVDLIHYPCVPTLLTQTSPLLFSKYSSIITVHDLTPMFFLNEVFKKKINKYYYKYLIKNLYKYKAIITDSNNTKNDIIKITNIKNNKIHPIYLAPVLKKRSYLELNSNFKEKYNYNYFLYVGDLGFTKNIDNLVLSISKIKNKINNLKLIIAGFVHDSVQKRIMNLVEKLSIKDIVIFTGYISDSELSHLYSNAEFFIFPSLYEGFGLPPLEALFHDTLVVSSNKGSLKEILKDSAIFFNPYDINDIADKILYIIENKKEVKNKLSPEINKIKEYYTWENTVLKTINVYETLLTNSI